MDHSQFQSIKRVNEASVEMLENGPFSTSEQTILSYHSTNATGQKLGGWPESLWIVMAFELGKSTFGGLYRISSVYIFSTEERAYLVSSKLDGGFWHDLHNIQAISYRRLELSLET